MIRNRSAIVVAAVLFILLALPVGAQNLEVAFVTVTPSSVNFEPTVPYERARLTVSGPAGIVLERSFNQSEEIRFVSLGIDDLPLGDGYYRYTLLVFSQRSESGAKEDGGSLKTSGLFRVQEGLIEAVEDPGTEQSSAVWGSGPVPELDHEFDDDVIVEGSVCSSGDDTCAGGESFLHDGGLAEFKLRGSQVSIWFADDEDKDFGIEVANDTFTILDEDTGTEPVVIEAGASNSTLHIDSTGSIGFGTATPAQEIHLLDTSVDLRLEHSTTGNIWDIRASDDLIFDNVDDGSGTGAGAVLTLQDAASGSTVPGVGIFQSSPEAQLHVESSAASNGVAKILVRADVGAPSIQLAVENDDAAGISITNGSGAGSDGEWLLVSSGNDSFVLSTEGQTGAEFVLEPNGDLTISGSLTELSSRASKRDFESVDGREVLRSILALPIMEWSYRDDRQAARHIGPMAEDFYAAFRLNASRSGIATLDTSGVTLAAIQGFNTEVAETLAEGDAEIARLRADIAKLRARMEQLIAAEADAPTRGQP